MSAQVLILLYSWLFQKFLISQSIVIMDVSYYEIPNDLNGKFMFLLWYTLPSSGYIWSYRHNIQHIPANVYHCKDTPFLWTPAAHNAFNALKATFLSDPMLDRDIIPSLREIHHFHWGARSDNRRDRPTTNALTKLYSFQQGSCPASVYASEFRQIACDVSWDDQALCNHFRCGLQNDVKTLLLNFPEPTLLSQVISQAIQCDNRLFKQSFVRLPTMLVGMTKPYATISIAVSKTMSRLFS